MMKRWIAVIVLGAWAWAAPLTTVYDRVASLMNQVQSVQSSNPKQASDLLRQADEYLSKEGSELSMKLREGISTALRDAQTALARKSRADLEARLQMVRSLLGKALYDSYFDALGNAQADAARALLPRLIAASALPKTLTAQIEGLGNDIDKVRQTLERTYAQGIVNALSRARSQTNATQAFLEATRAYTLYLVVQESPRATGLSARAFVNALSKLSNNDLAGFRKDIEALRQQAEGFLGRVNSSSPGAVRSSAPARTVTAPPAKGGAGSQVTQAQATPAAQSASKPAQAPQQVVAQAAPVKSDGHEERYEGKLDASTQARVEVVLARLGFADLGEWVRGMNLELRARLGEATAHVKSGNFEGVREYLELSHNAYKERYYPVVRLLDPALADRFDRLLGRMQEAVGLRATDLAVALAEVQEIEERLEGRSLGLGHALQVQLELLLLGIPRAFVFILAALLAVFPLYLVNLTFGGRNTYWRLLGLAFFFLFLPAMIEGLSYVASILADPRFGKLGFLAPLSTFSIQSSLMAQLLWGLTLFLVIGLSAAGLRGIAVQFGLIQDRRARANTTTVAQTNPGLAATAPMRAAADPKLTSETIVEWDEEF
ncbi:hypothetical protein Mrose_00870 [Calidithermus roseus]|uniref:Uncharacterized protein n=2 Tax=Calidithermus roseus TaxID=1644118 RepID=A0A399F159_9DEIN|nr:hypothetical protein Mrose_00870 [Calidithermus roseus]